jgi:DNA-binding NarL/FixJ family response regulator
MSPFRLTARELQVLSLIANGYTNPGIASLLCVAPSTVAYYIKGVLCKTQAATRAHAVAIWLQA